MKSGAKQYVRACRNMLPFYGKKEATVDKGIHDKSTKIELPTLYKVPPKRDYGRYFCRLARKEEPPHRGLMKSQAPFFMPKIRR